LFCRSIDCWLVGCCCCCFSAGAAISFFQLFNKLYSSFETSESIVFYICSRSRYIPSRSFSTLGSLCVCAMCSDFLFMLAFAFHDSSYKVRCLNLTDAMDAFCRARKKLTNNRTTLLALSVDTSNDWVEVGFVRTN
jgi:hypothetical protein